MENIGETSQTYWDSLHQIEDYSWGGLEETVSGYDDLSSPDGPQSATTSKNIVSERNRRDKLKNRLFALRAVVPNITKMDRASILKDAIDYIQKLHEQESTIRSELIELESRKLESENMDLCQNMSMLRSNQAFGASGSRVLPIEILDLNVSHMEEKIVVVRLECSKRRDTIVKLCEVFESLKLNIVTANFFAFSEKLFNTLFIQAEKEETEFLKKQVESAIYALNHTQFY